MTVYLPIAELSVDLLLLLALGAGVGVLAGLFGVGGGFLMTPLLILIGVPAAVAVATQASQLAASSVSGTLAALNRRSVDMTMAGVMLAGSLVGTGGGVLLFRALQRAGAIESVIGIGYVALLGTLGTLITVEGIRALLRREAAPLGPRRRHNRLQALPLRMKFARSGLYISALLPLGVGALGGLLVALFGVGGGFVLVPAMIYLIGMPAALVTGTSLLQMAATTAVATFLQAVTSRGVDLVLAAILIVGGVIGTQIGQRYAQRLRSEQSRALLGLLILAVAVALALELILPPGEPFSLEQVRR